MKVVLSFDSFKGGMFAQEACNVVEQAMRACCPVADIENIPLGDGGEGTAEILRLAVGGQWVPVTTIGPLPDMQVESGFVWCAGQKLAIVEMAKSSGLPLVPPSRRNPMMTTTYGTGQLLEAALRLGAEELWLTVGGSATVDGGAGAAMALGWKLLDESDNPIPLGGGGLVRLRRMIKPMSWSFPRCRVLCDVTNPLLGPTGAARTFGPQKGATPEMTAQLEEALAHLAQLIKAQFGLDISAAPGGGAAGGLAAGAIAFFNAELTSGIDAVLSALNYSERIRHADWVITGEGCFDRQSLNGKVVSGVIKAAKTAGARVAVLAGSVKLSEAEWRAAGVDYAVAFSPPDMKIEEAIAREREFLVEGARRLCEQMV